MSMWNPFSSNKNENKNKNRNSQTNYGRNRNQSRRNNRGRQNKHNNYDPYANYGRQNKYNDNNNCHDHKHQSQTQTYVNAQMQKTAQTQTFLEQVDDTVLCISLAGKSYQKGKDEETVNLLCDGAVVSLNMFAVSCEQLHQENNKDALDLGRKRMHDKLSELQSKNDPVYQMIAPHRNFIAAALNGQKDLRYKQDRVEPGAKTLFEQDPTEINRAFSKMIQHQQKFNKDRDAMMEPQTNQKLAKQHQSELNEYRRNYKNKSKSKPKSKSGPKVLRPKVNNLYFTKSGKEATFVDTKAVERAQQEEKAMDEDIFGSDDVYDEILPRKYMNAVLKLSKRNKYKNRSKPIPCLILKPNEQQRERHDKTYVKIMPCYPYNDVTLDAKLKLLELDEDVIKEYERKYIEQLRLYEVDENKQNLGYPTIEEQEAQMREIDVGDIYDEDDGDVDIDGNNSDSNI